MPVSKDDKFDVFACDDAEPPWKSVRRTGSFNREFFSNYHGGQNAKLTWGVPKMSSLSYDSNFTDSILSNKGYYSRRQKPQRFSLLEEKGGPLLFLGYTREEESKNKVWGQLKLRPGIVTKAKLIGHVKLLRTFVQRGNFQQLLASTLRSCDTEEIIKEDQITEAVQVEVDGINLFIEEDNQKLVVYNALELLEIKTKGVLDDIFKRVAKDDSKKVILHYHIDIFYVVCIEIEGVA